MNRYVCTHETCKDSGMVIENHVCLNTIEAINENKRKRNKTTSSNSKRNKWKQDEAMESKAKQMRWSKVMQSETTGSDTKPSKAKQNGWYVWNRFLDAVVADAFATVANPFNAAKHSSGKVILRLSGRKLDVQKWLYFVILDRHNFKTWRWLKRMPRKSDMQNMQMTFWLIQ